MPTMESARTTGGGGGTTKLLRDKSASFHGKVSTAHRTLRRPKTQPNLIAGSKDSGIGIAPLSASVTPESPDNPPAKKVPSKSLLNVTLRGSLAPMQIVASTDWTVGELVAALLLQYAKEGRRQQLPSSEPSDFALHYSQFSLQGLDPQEKLIKLGSRNFFLCPKPRSDTSPLTAAPPAPAAVAVEKASKGVELGGLRFMDFLL